MKRLVAIALAGWCVLASCPNLQAQALKERNLSDGPSSSAPAAPSAPAAAARQSSPASQGAPAQDAAPAPFAASPAPAAPMALAPLRGEKGQIPGFAASGRPGAAGRKEQGHGQDKGRRRHRSHARSPDVFWVQYMDSRKRQPRAAVAADAVRTPPGL